MEVLTFVTQLCLTLCEPMDCSLPGSSVRGILQARILEWIAISFSRGSSWPRDWTQVSRIAGRHFTDWPWIFYRIKMFENYSTSQFQGTSLVAQTVKHLSTMWESWVWALGWEDPLEKEMAIHSSTVAWKIPWTEEPGTLQSMGLQRVGHDWEWLHFRWRKSRRLFFLETYPKRIDSCYYHKTSKTGDL